MSTTIQQIEQIVSTLTKGEKRLLKDIINKGACGDYAWEFLDEKGNVETVEAYGYCVYYSYHAKLLKGCAITAMCQSICGKLCPAVNNQVGRYISHRNDWWGDGSADMLFIREGYHSVFEEWASGKGFKDEQGALRHSMSREDLDELYRRLDNFIADLTYEEAEQNRDAFNAVKTIIHQRMQEK